MSIDSDIAEIERKRAQAEDLMNRLDEAKQKLTEARDLENKADQDFSGF